MNRENTFREIPSLDIANKIMRTAIAKKEKPDISLDEIESCAYHTLQKTAFPFTLPVNLYHCLFNTVLNRSNTKTHELYRTMMTENFESDVFLREYLNISPEEYVIITGQKTNDDNAGTRIKEYWGLSAADSLNDLFVLNPEKANILTQSALSRVELDLLFKQNLSKQEIAGNKALNFFINKDLKINDQAYFLMVHGKNEKQEHDEIQLLFNNSDSMRYVSLKEMSIDEPLLITILDRLHRFIRLQRKLGWKAEELDWVLCHGCDYTLDNEALAVTAVTHYLNAVYSVPIHLVVSLWFQVKDIGKGEEEKPSDLYTTLFNNGYKGTIESLSCYCTDKNNRLIPNPQVTNRLLSSLRITDRDYGLLFEALKQVEPPEENATSTLSLQQLSFLHRLTLLARLNGVSIADILSLIALIQRNLFTTGITLFPPFISIDPNLTNGCNENLLTVLYNADNALHRKAITVIQLMHTIFTWMRNHAMSMDELAYICSDRSTPQRPEPFSRQELISLLSDITQQADTQRIKPEFFQSEIIDQQESAILYSALSASGISVIDSSGMVLKIPMEETIQSLLESIIKKHLFFSLESFDQKIELSDDQINTFLHYLMQKSYLDFDGYFDYAVFYPENGTQPTIADLKNDIRIFIKGILGSNPQEPNDDLLSELETKLYSCISEKINTYRTKFTISKKYAGEIVDKIKTFSQYQSQGLLNNVASAFGLDQPCLELILNATFKTPAEFAQTACSRFITPLLAYYEEKAHAGTLIDDGGFTSSFRRFLQMVILVKKADLTAAETATYLRSINACDGFPEKIKLPHFFPDQIDALFAHSNGVIHVYADGMYARYSGSDYQCIEAGVQSLLLEYKKNSTEKYVRLILPFLQELPQAIKDKIPNGFKIKYTYYYDVDEGVGLYCMYGEFPQSGNPTEKNRRYILFKQKNSSVEQISSEEFTASFINAGLTTKVVSASINGATALESSSYKTFVFFTNYFAVMHDDKTIDSFSPISDFWGHPDNWFKKIGTPIQSGQAGILRLDAAFEVSITEEGPHKNKKYRYFFCKDQYIRYTIDSEYEKENFIDEGYPKSLLKDWNDNEFIRLPMEIRNGVYAALEEMNGDTYLFSESSYISCRNPKNVSLIKDLWGRIKNNFQPENPNEDASIDAIFKRDGKTFLFSKDQYIVYDNTKDPACHNSKNGFVADEGYPVTIASNLVKGAVIQPPFDSDLDDTLQGHDGTIYLFKSNLFCTLASPDTEHFQAIKELWGKVRNNFQAEPASSTIKIDAAVIFKNKLFLFNGNQYVRYTNFTTPAAPEFHVDEGYPRTIGLKGNEVVRFNTLPEGKNNFKEGIDSSFVGFDDVLYLCRNHECVSSNNVSVPQLNTALWGSVVNNIASTSRINAGFVDTEAAYFFSGDQYVKYVKQLTPGSDDFFVAEGYPKKITNWNNTESEPETDSSKAVALFSAGIDAAFKGSNNEYYYFKDDSFSSSSFQGTKKINEIWGKCPVADMERVYAAVTTPDGLTHIIYKKVNDDQTLRQWIITFKYELSRYSAIGVPKELNERFKSSDGKPLFSKPVCAAFVCPTVTDANIPNTCRGKIYIFTEDEYGRFSYQNNSFELESVIKKISTGKLKTNEGEWFFGFELALEGHHQHLLMQPSIFTDISNAKIRINILYKKTSCDHFDFHLLQYSHEKCENIYIYKWKDYDSPISQAFQPVDSALNALDGTIYLFHEQTCATYANSTLSAIKNISSIWGSPSIPNGFDRIDAAFVSVHAPDDIRTYIFYKDRYARYDGIINPLAASFYVKENYPKSIDQFPNEGIPITLPVIQENLIHYINKCAIISCTMKKYFLFYEKKYSDSGSMNQSSPAISDHWGIVENRFKEENAAIHAALNREGNAKKILYLFSRDQYIRYSNNSTAFVDEGYPKKIDRNWHRENTGVSLVDDISTVAVSFISIGDTLYRFMGTTYVSVKTGQPATEEIPISDHWGKVYNLFQLSGEDEKNIRVDASLVCNGATNALQTYLFSKNQYIRYTGSSYEYVDEGYPKIINNKEFSTDPTNWQAEGFPLELEDDLSLKKTALYQHNNGVIYYFRGGQVSDSQGGSHAIKQVWGKVKNNIQDTNAVDAAVLVNVKKEEIGSEKDITYRYLFCSDQYGRYTVGSSFDASNHMDEGYPKSLQRWKDFEKPFDAMLSDAIDGIDAAYVRNIHSTDRYLCLIRNNTILTYDFNTKTIRATEKVTETIGTIHNNLQQAAPVTVDAAFIAPDSTIYLFAQDQYFAYDRLYCINGAPPSIMSGFPKKIIAQWGDPSGNFNPRDGIAAAFVFEARTYLFDRTNYVRYSYPIYTSYDRNFPRIIKKWWKDIPDFSLDSVQGYSRFKRLSNAFSTPDRSIIEYLDSFSDISSLKNGSTIKQIIALLCNTTGWKEEQVLGLMPNNPSPESLSDLPVLYHLQDLFEYADQLGTTPVALRHQAAETFASIKNTDDDSLLQLLTSNAATLEYLISILKAKTEPDTWKTIEKELHNAANLSARDAMITYLVEYLDQSKIKNPRDLYEYFLHDVEMGEKSTTSLIQEAIACVQLFYHRVLMKLETNHYTNLIHLKSWWDWMKNYRIWEANRKVFLYPENYIRSELRRDKSPAFKKLEDELLQNEITDEAAEKVFKNYLDEYAEVSRLIIAGGYFYEDAKDNNRYAVLFGYTRTEPKKYYYRLGKVNILSETVEIPITWAPWLETGITMNASKVYPVYAFNRLFVFWTELREINESDLNASGATKKIRYTPIISYSYYNLNKSWINPQTLVDMTQLVKSNALFLNQTDDPKIKTMIENGSIYLTNPSKSAEYSSDEYIYLYYLIQEAKSGIPKYELIGKLTSDLEFDSKNENDDLKGIKLKINTKESLPEDRFKIKATSSIIMKSYLRDTVTAPWYSFNAKGGNFLCIPEEISSITDKDIVDAGAALNEICDLPNDNTVFKNWKNTIDAGFIDGAITYLFSGQHYYAIAGTFCKKKLITDTFDLLLSKKLISSAFRLNTILYLFYTKKGSGDFFITYDSDVSTRYIKEVRPAEAPDDGLTSVIPASYINIVWKRKKTDPDTVKEFFSCFPKLIDNAFVFKDSLFLFNGFEFTVIDIGILKTIDGLKEIIQDWTAVRSAFVYSNSVYLIGLTEANGVTSYSMTSYNKADKDAQWTALKSIEDFSNNKLSQCVAAIVNFDNKVALFTNKNNEETEFSTATMNNNSFQFSDLTFISTTWGKRSFFKNGVNSACIHTFNSQKRLYLFCAGYYCCYAGETLDIPLDGYPLSIKDDLKYVTDKDESAPIDAALLIPVLNGDNTNQNKNEKLYLFSGDTYNRYSIDTNGNFLADYTTPIIIQSNWGNLPMQFNQKIDASVYNSATGLLCLFNGEYLDLKDSAISQKAVVYGDIKPYEFNEIHYTIHRLTTNTSQRLTQRLLAKGISGLLSLETQLFKELPMFTQDKSMESNDTIYYSSEYIDSVPKGSLKDTELKSSATNALNPTAGPEGGDQPTDLVGLDFDSANGSYYWEIFFHGPFLIAMTLNGNQKFKEAKKWYEYIYDPTKPVETDNRTACWNFLPFKNMLDCKKDIDTTLKWESNENQFEVYKDDPFDPHAIAWLRKVAYIKTIVMNYIDTIVDWGDMLFSQYTRETINEARMLYVLGYDLLGEKPASLGKKEFSEEKTIEQLMGSKSEKQAFTIDPDIIELENDPVNALLEIPKTSTYDVRKINDTILSEYFYIPENELFVKYWDRVEDRLFKIRHSQNIEGIEQLLALFEPPIDPMALVNAVASGGGIAQALADYSISVPSYRFSFVLAKAKELVSRLNQLSSALLGALEKKDSEELSLIRQNQEREIHSMTMKIKDDQLKDREETIKSITANLGNANCRRDHYMNLIIEYMNPQERANIALLSVAQAFTIISQVFETIAAFGYLGPQLGSPFAITYGGQQIGNSFKGFGAISNSLSNNLTFAANICSTIAGYERRKQDWELQKRLAEGEITQIAAQLEGANIQKRIATHEIAILKRQMEHNESITSFMQNKFTNKDLYQWMIGRISKVYFQTYQMALDYAKLAQKAFQFELGVPESSVNYISSYYWDSLKKGLLAGESLQLDLDRMEKAYYQRNERRFEISKTISLLLLDPMALLQLKTNRVCTFSLTERLFDLDFPGHYCRQIKTISLTFPSIVGPYQNLNATLTQMGHKTLLEPDKDGLAYLNGASAQAPQSVRVDWRSYQQVALSRGVNDSGLFQLNFQDERYLPFEGTGAVSNWKLALNGIEGMIDLSTLSDVIIKIEYTAKTGGESFEKAVKKEIGAFPNSRIVLISQEYSDQWNYLLQSPKEPVTIRLTKTMFPGITANVKDMPEIRDHIQSVFMLYDLTEKGKQELKRAKMEITAPITCALSSGEVNGKVKMSFDKQGYIDLTLRIIDNPAGIAAKFSKETIKNIALVFVFYSKFNVY
ncbi:hypothetical protein JW979_03520 [bacterium]|nr:hypothetical protein [candidate division CSSED10-310 bacterium]